MKIINIMCSISTRICEPNKASLSYDQDGEVVFKRNKLFFWALLWVILLHPLLRQMGNLGCSVERITMLWNVFNFLTFILFCRSYLWIFNLYFTLSISFAPMLLLIFETQFAFIFNGFSVAMPALVLMVTNDFKCMLFSGAMQVLTSLTLLKEVLIEDIIKSDARAFAQKFVDANIIFLIFIMTLFGIVLHSLQKKTKELSAATLATSEALDQQRTFIFSFSHELRNPLNSLLGNIQLLLMSNLSPEAKGMLKTAQICGELLLQLINNVLDAGKRDLGNLEINLAPTNIYDLFQRIWTISNELIVRKCLKSCLKIDKKVLPVILIDGYRINQVMMNLIGNAIKFTDTGSISITVKWLDLEHVGDKCFEPIPYDDDGLFEKEENFEILNLCNYKKQTIEHIILDQFKKELDPNEISSSAKKVSTGVLKIIVKDTGCGMGKECVQRLFQKFSQVCTDTHKRQIGTGLGLYITKEICRQMNGDVRVYSKLGVGSTFIACIPASSIPTVTSHQHLTDSLETMSAQLIRRKLKAIVADDPPFNVNLLCNYFAKLNAQIIETTANGYDAYQKYTESRKAGIEVDIVTLDIDMPTIDGKTACQKIREFEREKNIKPIIIILISGNYDEQQVDQFFNKSKEKKADYFLKKPLVFEDFCSALFLLTSKIRKE